MKRTAVIGGAALGIAALLGWTIADMGQDGVPSDHRAATRQPPSAEPQRCARLSHDGAGAGDGLARTLDMTADDVSAGELILGVVADARDVRDHLGAIRQAFADHGVHVVVSLGGMATTEVEAVLSELTGPWPVVAIPGDRESLASHRAACEALTQRGVIDGSRIRSLSAGAVVMATFPGAPHVRRLMSGKDGCVHTAQDAGSLGVLYDNAETTRRSPGDADGAGGGAIRVLLTHTPPRQRGAEGTDLAPGAIHIGELWLAEAITAAGVDLVIHGLIATSGTSGLRGAAAGAAAKGQATLAGDKPVVLGAGTADGVLDAARLLASGVSLRETRPAPGLIVTISVAKRSVRWDYLSWDQAAKKYAPEDKRPGR